MNFEILLNDKNRDSDGLTNSAMTLKTEIETIKSELT